MTSEDIVLGGVPGANVNSHHLFIYLGTYNFLFAFAVIPCSLLQG
jgi:hypothetical protein